ncbi:uncharacterized protein PRCAT00004678001 [Priceomyces carsonii]|uniref:uncharacterized protein n=1 Tax=Priceomyces carsonii TaxID=28549 RepID=UPI002EDA805C|nr:unnamed protein product [Priceomyces carsonii]
MSTDRPYLDIETIKNAAELVNSTLISKAYIDDEIKFISIDWKDLLKNQVSDLKITEEIYNNDKNGLNIIYSLLQALDRSKAQHRSSNKILGQKDAMIGTLNKKIESLESRLVDSESRLDKVIQFDKGSLTKKVQELSRINKIQTQDLNKLKIWCSDVRAKYHIELKKKNLEIDQLRNKLISKRNLSSTITYGRPLSSSPSEDIPNVNLNVVHNNIPSIDNSSLHVHQSSNLEPLIQKEYEEIVSGLTTVIESLVTENFKLATFIKSLNDYYTNLNNQISNSKFKNLETNLLNPSEAIDLNAISNSDSDETKKHFDEMESFDYVAKPLLNNIYRNYHNISNLVEQISTNSMTSHHESEDMRKIKQLTEELEITKRNWQEAIKTLESWKAYRRKSDVKD